MKMTAISSPKRTGLFKTLRLLKLSTIITCVLCLQVNAAGISQTISLQGKNMSIEKVFSEIESQTGYVIACNYELIKHAKPVTIAAKDQALESFIKQVLKGQNLQYSIQNKTIFISKSVAAVLSSNAVFAAEAIPPPPVT